MSSAKARKSIPLLCFAAMLLSGTGAAGDTTSTSLDEETTSSPDVSAEIVTLMGEEAIETLDQDEVRTLAICVGNCSGWVARQENTTVRYYKDLNGHIMAKVISTVQFYHACATCRPSQVRGFATARRYSPVSRIQLGQDVPSTPSVRLGVAGSSGGVILDNPLHFNSGSDCCVTAYTAPVFIEYVPGNPSAEAYQSRFWVSFRTARDNLLYEFTQTSPVTDRNYVYYAVGIGNGGCVGAGCGGM